jgi:uncharacterized protein (DUF433 family)
MDHVNPRQGGTRSCHRVVRIRVTYVVDLLLAGLSTQEIVAELPDLDVAGIEAALHFARSRIDHPVIVCRCFLIGVRH